MATKTITIFTKDADLSITPTDKGFRLHIMDMDVAEIHLNTPRRVARLIAALQQEAPDVN